MLSLDSGCDMEDECLDPNAFCYQSRCVCKTEYYPKNGKCAPRGVLGAPCLTRGTCIDPNNICANNGMCRCRQDFYESSGICCMYIIHVTQKVERSQSYDRAQYKHTFSATVPRVDLGGPCYPGDECDDPSAICWQGQCRCRMDFYEDAGRCGEYFFFIDLQYIHRKQCHLK